jgi:hypothetical protein
MSTLTRLLYLMTLAVLLFGCATTKAVGTIAKSCEPSTDQEAAILDAAAKPTQAEALAAIDALGFVLCVAQRGVDEAIASLQPKPGEAALALSAASYSPVLDNLREWRKRHP